MNFDLSQISALVLAGGRGQRMGGVDKGLHPLRGRPLVSHAIERLEAAVQPVRINANRNQDAYRALGYPVIGDQLSDYQGPLAGIASGLHDCPTPWMLVIPCDSPCLPRDLATRLMQALVRDRSELAVAHDGERLQPVVALLPRTLLPSLQDYLAGGDRKIDRWYAQHRMNVVDFSDQADAFLNINTLQEKAALEADTPIP